MTKKEIRSFGVELRDVAPGGSRELYGYAALFNVESNPLDGFNEIIMPGAFTKTLQENLDLKCLWNHNTDIPLGRTPKTLSVVEDDKGLAFTLQIPNTSYGKDLIELASLEIANQCSFGFFVVADEWLDRDGGLLPLRRLHEITLLELSVMCVFPAYNEPETYLRHLDEKKTLQSFQKRQLSKLLASILDTDVNSIR